jgi:hypothetical protein
MAKRRAGPLSVQSTLVAAINTAESDARLFVYRSGLVWLFLSIFRHVRHDSKASASKPIKDNFSALTSRSLCY